MDVAYVQSWDRYASEWVCVQSMESEMAAFWAPGGSGSRGLQNEPGRLRPWWGMRQSETRVGQGGLSAACCICLCLCLPGPASNFSLGDSSAQRPFWTFFWVVARSAHSVITLPVFAFCHLRQTYSLFEIAFSSPWGTAFLICSLCDLLPLSSTQGFFLLWFACF